MSGYVLRRTDQGGGYVAESGSDKSYTHQLENAKRFPTREAADADRCKGNEVIVPVDQLLRPMQ